jgi:putative ABC transport system substrate-binding protein
VVGFLGANNADSQRHWTSAFVKRLQELGWIEGRTVAIEYRWGEGRSDRLAEIAAELVRLKVDVLVTHSAEPILAAKQATSVIPIVFAAAADPVGNRLVATLARPGGNVTGLSLQFTDLAGKRLELLREMADPLLEKTPGRPKQVLVAVPAAMTAHDVDEIGRRQIPEATFR